MLSREKLKPVLARILPYPIYFHLNSWVATREILSGRRSEVGLDVVSKYVSLGDTVVDLGANFGLYSHHMARLVGPTGRVHAFEPIPPTLAILRRTLRRAENVSIHPEAVGEKSGHADFLMPVGNHVPLMGETHRGNGEEGIPYRCQMCTLDEVLKDEVSFIKADIEGAELFAFRGAERIFARSRPTVYCEVIARHLARFSLTPEDVFSFFESRGYCTMTHDGTPRGGDAAYLFIHKSRG
ncbi:MAG TPA: FkbM family methyltransferase [Acidobacteriaceae bacterium]|nr:FkbM family methyltransferase [Acidobacteriaceae bacterium]